MKTPKLMPRRQESEEVKTRKVFYFPTLARRWTMHNSQGWTAGDNAFISYASRCNQYRKMSGVQTLHIKMALTNDNQKWSNSIRIKYVEHWKLHKTCLRNMTWYTTSSKVDKLFTWRGQAASLHPTLEVSMWTCSTANCYKASRLSQTLRNLYQCNFSIPQTC